MDGEEAYVHVKPEPIETYLQTTLFSRRELQAMYRGFKQSCPTGVVREETFKAMFSQFFPKTSETDSYASLVYQSIDKRSSLLSSTQTMSVVSFTGLVLTLSVLARGSVQDKLNWAFRLYDDDGDGVLSYSDLTRVLTAIHQLLGPASGTTDPEVEARNHAQKVMQRMDIDGDGYVSRDDFMSSCLSDQAILQSLENLDTVF